MSTIKVLNDEIINKIAAGEVVEKPASIVKELVENSIDAGAKEIIVEVKNGGIGFIRIQDNGKGIDKADLSTAFLRHATSKITSDADLNVINTLGFRGEALASIAAISKVEMCTRVKNSDLGAKIVIEGGIVKFEEECGCSKGTTITVRDVFYNTPARLKFLKTESREGIYITEVMQSLSLSHPFISFKYRLNDKLIFATKGDGDLKAIVLSIYGKEIANNVIDIFGMRDFITVKGFAGNSNISKGSRNYQSIFVNGRTIKNKSITAAVETAYKSMLTINKFPFFIIYVDVNAEFVDVNVHPSKSEVKFQDDQMVFKAVFHAVKDSLAKVADIMKTDTGIEDINNQKSIKDDYYQEKMKIDLLPRISYTTNNNSLSEFEAFKEKKIPDTKEIYEEKDIKEKAIELVKEEINENKEENLEAAENKIPKFGPLSIIGQIHFTYIIAEGPDEMIMIDQHAAHERIYYEKYMNQFIKAGVKSQELLVPLVIEVSLTEKELVFENIEVFKKLGYKIEDFGGNSVSIRCVPVIFGNPDAKEMFNETVASLSEKDKSMKTTTDKIIFSMACKSAIKAGDKLSFIEMKKLIDELRFCDNPYNCPHGRPTIIKMTITEIEKKFKRIQ